MPKDLEAQYQWIIKDLADNNGGPKLIAEALKHYGVEEGAGSLNNQTIMGWAREVDQNLNRDLRYIKDEIPWCRLFMAKINMDAGKTVVKEPLWALNWANYGTHSPIPSFGDVMVFTRKKGGHVALYIGEDSTHYHILGGNQSSTSGGAVNISRRLKAGLYTARREYKIAVPTNVRVVKLKKTGIVMSDEA